VWQTACRRLDYQAHIEGRWKYMENDLLTQQEAGRYLRVSLKSLRRLVREGKLPEVRLGPRLPRYRVRDLDALVAAA
jgi:excisionase family DNA binding protein